ncbi:MAG TPA: hypothetical protein VNA89_08440 [Gemmatimonadaceae bacterium]|nr:hypothetical protein [Gemmatimonadaceae bacterium]
MQRFVKVAALAALAAGVSASAEAQWLKAPVLVFQPGVITTNVISAPDDADSESGFNVRFTMVVPTAAPHFNLVMGTQFLPNGLGGSGINAPIFYYGGIIPLAPVTGMTQNFINASINPLGVYSGANYGSRPYSHEFYIELALVANVGAKMMANMGLFSNLGLYLLLDQQITHIQEDANGDKDRFNPVVLYGLTLPIAPWPGSR